MDNSFIKYTANDIADLVYKKNADYGNSFDDTINKYGYVAYFIRIEDKLSRLRSLMLAGNTAQVKSEKVEDTLKDIVGYTLLMLNNVNEGGN